MRIRAEIKSSKRLINLEIKLRGAKHLITKLDKANKTAIFWEDSMCAKA